MPQMFVPVLENFVQSLVSQTKQTRPLRNYAAGIFECLANLSSFIPMHRSIVGVIGPVGMNSANPKKVRKKYSPKAAHVWRDLDYL